MGRVALSAPIGIPEYGFQLPAHLQGRRASRVAIYKSWQEPMEAGWTRWVFDQHKLRYDTLHDADVQRAVRFAAARRMLVSVRGGGHHIAGNAVAEGGLMIDAQAASDLQTALKARFPQEEVCIWPCRVVEEGLLRGV